MLRSSWRYLGIDPRPARSLDQVIHVCIIPEYTVRLWIRPGRLLIFQFDYFSLQLFLDQNLTSQLFIQLFLGQNLTSQLFD